MPLNSVVIPCLAKDLAQFGRLLRIWGDARFFPRNGADISRPIPLVVVLNRAEHSVHDDFIAEYMKHDGLHQVFSPFFVENADLRGDADIYVRNSLVSRGQYGNKAGPNWLFFKTMKFLERFGGFTLQNEVDCFPLQRGWLDDLTNIVAMREHAWVIGSMYTGDIPVARDIQYHLNGNALYHVGNSRFQDFLDSVWKPRTFGSIDIDPNLAYDCWWATEKSRASNVIKNESWKLVSLYDQYFCSCQFLVNILHVETMIGDISDAMEDERASGQRVVLLHGGPLIEIFDQIISANIDGRTFFITSRSHKDSIASGTAQARAEDNEPLDDAAVNALLAARSSSRDIDVRTDVVIRPIEIAALPTSITAVELDSNAFAGSWHLGTDAGHVWAGPGNSTIAFRLRDRVEELEVTVDCRLHDGLDDNTLIFRVFGGDVSQVERVRDKGFVGRIRNRRGIKEMTLLFSAEEFMKPPGDERELSFVLFSIGLRP